jgi:DNA adenine methylase
MNYVDSPFDPQIPLSSTACQPFLKWAGGKRWLFRRCRDLFPNRVSRLIDPFLGGGSSFFLLQPQTAILSDLNQDLMELYIAVRDNPKQITRRLIRHQHAHSDRYYYKARAQKPTDPIERAAWLLYLNRTCWNGLFRVNLRGEFNVPIGTKTKIFESINELDIYSAQLRRAILLCADFEDAIDCAKKAI